MKNPLLAALMIAVVFSGCAPRYNIVLSSGEKLTARGKPHRDAQGFIVFKDGNGQMARISSGRVRTIEPVH